MSGPTPDQIAVHAREIAQEANALPVADTARQRLWAKRVIAQLAGSDPDFQSATLESVRYDEPGSVDRAIAVFADFPDDVKSAVMAEAEHGWSDSLQLAALQYVFGYSVLYDELPDEPDVDALELLVHVAIGTRAAGRWRP